MGVVWSSVKSAVCNIPTEQPVLAVEPEILQTVQRFKSTNPYFKLHIILLSLLFFTLTFITVNLISWISRSFKQLVPSLEVFWCQTFVSITFSLLVTPLALLLIIDSHLKADIVHNISLTSILLLSIGIGYNLHEIITQLTAYILFDHWNSYLMIHDTISILGSTLMLYYDQGHFLGCMTVLTEVPIAFRCLVIVLKDIRVSSIGSHLFSLVSICLDIYCPLMGAYCIVLTCLQWDAIEGEMSFLILFITYPSLLVELFIVATQCSYNSMRELFQSNKPLRVVTLSSKIVWGK